MGDDVDVRVSPGQTKDGRPYALVRFTEPGRLPEYRTCRLDPDAMDSWDETVTAFILERRPRATMWQGCLW